MISVYASLQRNVPCGVTTGQIIRRRNRKSKKFIQPLKEILLFHLYLEKNIHRAQVKKKFEESRRNRIEPNSVKNRITPLGNETFMIGAHSRFIVTRHARHLQVYLSHFPWVLQGDSSGLMQYEIVWVLTALCSLRLLIYHRG